MRKMISNNYSDSEAAWGKTNYLIALAYVFKDQNITLSLLHNYRISIFRAFIDQA